jgi:hypothetical protein
MPTRRLVWLDVWILCWLRADAQRSMGLLAASAQKLLAGFARQEQQQICASLAFLETKGLIVVGRTPGGKSVSLALTAAGYQCVPQIPGRFDV